MPDGWGPVTGLQTATLRGWKLVGNTLTGRVYGHPKFIDRSLIHTSELTELPVRVPMITGGPRHVAKTRNTIYTLEDPA